MNKRAASFDQRIEAGDISLFAPIPSQTAPEDRVSLLALQRRTRRKGDYVYLEIGSHLGGTLQTFYADPKCRRIYSIDKRPLTQPDERGEAFHYPDNSTALMRQNLRRAFPEVSPEKLITFDSDAGAVDPAAITEAPDICFVDGEHTNAAVVSDLHFCLRVSRSDAIIAVHDAGIVAEGLRTVRRELEMKGIPHVRLMLAGSVYAFALGESATAWRDECAALLQDEERYFRASALYLRRLRREARLRRWPLLLHGYRRCTAVLDWSYKRCYLPLLQMMRSGFQERR